MNGINCATIRRISKRESPCPVLARMRHNTSSSKSIAHLWYKEPAINGKESLLDDVARYDAESCTWKEVRARIWEHVIRTEFLPWENPMTAKNRLRSRTIRTRGCTSNGCTTEHIISLASQLNWIGYLIRCRSNANNQASDAYVIRSTDAR